MWTASIVGKSKAGGIVTLVINYTNGEESFNQTYPFSTAPVNLDYIIVPKLKQLEALDAFLENTVIGPITPDEKAPSQDELDKKAFFENYGKLQSLQVLVDKGVILSSNQSFVDLQVLVKSQYKPEYFI